MAEGFVGLLDFAGYPVGVETFVPSDIGFVGLLDFAGYPVGTDETGPEPTPEGTYKPTWRPRRR